MATFRLARFDRFTTVLGLVLLTFVLGVGFGEGAWGRLAVVVVQCLTLLVALGVSRARHAVVVVARVAVVAALLVAVADPLFPDSDFTTGTRSVVSGLLAAVGPLAVWSGLRRRTSKVDLETVAGALSIYLMLGFTFAFTFGAIEIIGGEPFFVQLPDGARPADTLYFAFTTLTTTGYGDLTAATDLGRSVALLAAIVGQLYLVTVVALIVGNLGRTRSTDR